jgi:hypothetical protein
VCSRCACSRCAVCSHPTGGLPAATRSVCFSGPYLCSMRVPQQTHAAALSCPDACSCCRRSSAPSPGADGCVGAAVLHCCRGCFWASARIGLWRSEGCDVLLPRRELVSGATGRLQPASPLQLCSERVYTLFAGGYGVGVRQGLVCDTCSGSCCTCWP